MQTRAVISGPNRKTSRGRADNARGGMEEWAWRHGLTPPRAVRPASCSVLQDASGKGAAVTHILIEAASPFAFCRETCPRTGQFLDKRGTMCTIRIILRTKPKGNWKYRAARRTAPIVDTFLRNSLRLLAANYAQFVFDALLSPLSNW